MSDEIFPFLLPLLTMKDALGGITIINNLVKNTNAMEYNALIDIYDGNQINEMIDKRQKA